VTTFPPHFLGVLGIAWGRLEAFGQQLQMTLPRKLGLGLGEFRRLSIIERQGGLIY